jgi:hypothetical protein
LTSVHCWRQVLVDKNMNRLARELNRGQKEVEAAQGNLVFTWAGNDYPCTVNQGTAEQMLSIGGFQLHSDLTLIVRTGVLPSTKPKEKQTLTFAGRGYRIDKVLTTHGGGLTTLVCNDPAQGA